MEHSLTHTHLVHNSLYKLSITPVAGLCRSLGALWPKTNWPLHFYQAEENKKHVQIQYSQLPTVSGVKGSEHVTDRVQQLTVQAGRHDPQLTHSSSSRKDVDPT